MNLTDRERLNAILQCDKIIRQLYADEVEYFGRGQSKWNTFLKNYYLDLKKALIEGREFDFSDMYLE